MKYQLRCLTCGATCWASGEEDPDTNGFDVEFGKDDRWEPESSCEHEDFEVVDSELEDLSGNFREEPTGSNDDAKH